MCLNVGRLRVDLRRANALRIMPRLGPSRLGRRKRRLGLADVVVVGAGGVAAGTWGRSRGQKYCGDKFDKALAESTGRRRLHGTLRSARLEHG